MVFLFREFFVSLVCFLRNSEPSCADEHPRVFCLKPPYLLQADAEADAKAMERAMSIWNLEFHDPILETVSLRESYGG